MTFFIFMCLWQNLRNCWRVCQPQRRCAVCQQQWKGIECKTECIGSWIRREGGMNVSHQIWPVTFHSRDTMTRPLGAFTGKEPLGMLLSFLTHLQWRHTGTAFGWDYVWENDCGSVCACGCWRACLACGLLMLETNHKMSGETQISPEKTND